MMNYEIAALLPVARNDGNNGYAAAFSVVIFVILLVFSIFFVRRTKGTEGAY